MPLLFILVNVLHVALEAQPSYTINQKEEKKEKEKE